MKKLTNEQIIKICDNVIKSVKDAKKYNKSVFLCHEVEEELESLLCDLQWGILFQTIFLSLLMKMLKS